MAVPKGCLSFSSGAYPAEVESRDPDYRRFRHTERNLSGVPIFAGDRLQVVTVEIAVDHLTQDERDRCLKMEVIADAEVDGKQLKTSKTVAELLGV